MSFWSSPSVIGWSGFLRSWLWVVVKPLTSSPAMPMTTWVGPKAGHLLGFLERDRAVVDDGRDVGDGPRLHVGRPWRLRPTPRTVPWPVAVDVEDERLGELGPDVERRAGGQRFAGVALPDAAPEGHQAPFSSLVADRGEGLGQTGAARARGPGPSAGGRRRAPRSPASPTVTRSPAEMPRATRSSETVTKSCGSSASSASATTPGAERAAHVAGRGLERVHRFVGPAAADARRTPGATSCAAAASSPGLGRPAPPPALRRRFVSRSSSWSAATRSAIDPVGLRADGLGGPLEDIEALANERVRGGPGDGLDPAHARSRCCARR